MNPEAATFHFSLAKTNTVSYEEPTTTIMATQKETSCTMTPSGLVTILEISQRQVHAKKKSTTVQP